MIMGAFTLTFIDFFIPTLVIQVLDIALTYFVHLIVPCFSLPLLLLLILIKTKYTNLSQFILFAQFLFFLFVFLLLFLFTDLLRLTSHVLLRVRR